MEEQGSVKNDGDEMLELEVVDDAGRTSPARDEAKLPFENGAIEGPETFWVSRGHSENS